MSLDKTVVLDRCEAYDRIKLIGPGFDFSNRSDGAINSITLEMVDCLKNIFINIQSKAYGRTESQRYFQIGSMNHLYHAYCEGDHKWE
jgi:hypothetical protein